MSIGIKKTSSGSPRSKRERWMTHRELKSGAKKIRRQKDKKAAKN